MELIAMALLLVLSTCVGLAGAWAILETICVVMLRTALKKEGAVTFLLPSMSRHRS